MIEFDVDSMVKGITEQAKALLGDALGEDALRAVGFAGAEVFRDEARRNALAHVKSGTIYRNIIVKRVEEESDSGTRQVYIVTVRSGKKGGNDAYYWRWVENGHKFVPRNPKRGKGANWKAHRALAAMEFGTALVGAKPFMRPAYESKKAEAIAVMQAKLKDFVKKATA